MVDFFFVLSGFVIYHSYHLKLNTVTEAGTFIFLRIGRLYPLHVATLFVFLFIELAKYIAEVRYGIIANTPAFTVNNSNSFVANILMVHAWNFQDRPTWNGPSWSISAEFFAYISFAIFILIFGTHKKIKQLLPPILSIISFYYIYTRYGYLDIFAQGSVIRCTAGFYLGISIYQCRSIAIHTTNIENYRFMINSLIIATFASMIYLMSVNTEGSHNFILPVLFSIVVLCLSLLPSNYGVNKWFNAKWLRWLGMVSFSIYLVHQIILWAATQFLRVILKAPQNAGHLDPGLLVGNALLLLSVTLILLISHFSFYWIEDKYRKKTKDFVNAHRGDPVSLK